MRIKLGSQLTAENVAEAIGGSIKNSIKGKEITHATTDTRELEPGDLFIGLGGENFNGNNFIEEAEKKGAITVGENSRSNITVESSDQALLNLAFNYKKKLRNLMHTVAITGSVGKTTTKEFSRIILSQKFKTHATLKNYNNLIGLPLTVLSTPEDTEVLILEMGMNHLGEISEMSKCATPTLALITNIGTAHIGNLGSRENIAKAKLEILDGMSDGQIILPYGEKLLKNTENSIYYSTKHNEANIYLQKKNNKLLIRTNNYMLETKDCNLVGEHNLECLCAAIAISDRLGIDSASLIRSISLVSNDNTRQNVIKIHDTTIVDDSYNASLESICSGLHSLKEYKSKNSSAVIGSVLETGESCDFIHYEIGKAVAESGISKVYLFGSMAKLIAKGAIDNGYSVHNIFINENEDSPQTTAMQIKENLSEYELIYFKASNKIRLSRIIDELTKILKEEKYV